jgi:hypothetical protein
VSDSHLYNVDILQFDNIILNYISIISTKLKSVGVPLRVLSEGNICAKTEVILDLAISESHDQTTKFLENAEKRNSQTILQVNNWVFQIFNISCKNAIL